MTLREGLPVVVGKPIDTSKDGPLLLHVLATELETTSHNIRGWISRGRLSADKKRIVRLQHVKMPGGLASTRKAYFEFLELLNMQHADSPPITVLKWTRPFYTDGTHAIFRFAIDDLRWLSSMMANDDVLKIRINQAIEELT